MGQLKSSNFRDEWNKLELLEQPEQNGTPKTKLSYCNKNGIIGTMRNRWNKMKN